MPTPPARSSLFPTGSLSPSSAKTLFGEWYDYCVALLGSSGSATDARTALGAAADADVVKLAGTQTITGAKTFSTSPVVPTPATSDNSTKAASTAWVRSAMSNIASAAGFVFVGSASSGYLVLPSWLGGVIFQWGSKTGPATGTTDTIVYQTTYPNAVYGCWWFFTAVSAAFSQSSNPGLSNCVIGIAAPGISWGSGTVKWFSVGY